MKKSPLNRLDKNGLISSVEGAASGAYRKSALNMLGISRKSSPLNELTQRQEQMREIIRQKNPKENPTGKPEKEPRKSVSRKSSSPLNDNGIQTPSILEENPGENPTFTPGTPWSQYSNAEVKANAGSGKPLPTQYYQGRKVNPNINDAWQTAAQAQATEDLENSNN